MKNLHERAVEAAIRFVERKGLRGLGPELELRGRGGPPGSGGHGRGRHRLHRRHRGQPRGGRLQRGNLTREQFELLAATWLEGYTPEATSRSASTAST